MNETTPVATQGASLHKLPDPVTLTEAAADRLKDITAKAAGEGAALGVRLSLAPKGCSGQKYKMEVAREAIADDILVEQYGARLFIDRKAELFLIGTTIDFKVGQLQSGFVFNNPNETGRCGCGESVTFKKQSDLC